MLKRIASAGHRGFCEVGYYRQDYNRVPSKWFIWLIIGYCKGERD